MRTLWCTLILGWRNLGYAFPDEVRTPWCALILGRRNVGFAFPERDANRMVHTHSGLAKPTFCTLRTRCDVWCTLILAWRNLSFTFPERDANPMVHTHSGLAECGFCIPRTRCEPYGAYSFWVGETLVLHSENDMRTMLCALILGLRNLWFCIPRTRCEPYGCLLYTSPSPRDLSTSRMPSSA